MHLLMAPPYLHLAFAEAMSPGGLVPEITNGRGAMAAMLIAFVKELTTGKPVAEQIKSDPIFIVVIFGLIILGSVAPVFRGADLNQKGAGPFTPRAEIWNGRVVRSWPLPANLLHSDCICMHESVTMAGLSHLAHTQALRFIMCCSC